MKSRSVTRKFTRLVLLKVLRADWRAISISRSASGGYPWTIIPLERRDDYMDALESASVKLDIQPFAAFLGGLVEAGLREQFGPWVPASGRRS